MSRINVCPACSLYDRGGKSRIAIPHTCGKGEFDAIEIAKTRVRVKTLDERAREFVNQFADKLQYNNGTSAGAVDCALLAIEHMLIVQRGFYGLVFSPQFRERCQMKVDELEDIKRIIQSFNK